MIRIRVATAAAGVSLLFAGFAAGTSPAQAATPAGSAAVSAHSAGLAAAWPAKPTDRSRDKKLTDPRVRWRNDNHGLPAAPDQVSILSVTREYAVGSQSLSNTGIDGNMTGINPHVSYDDGGTLGGHSIAEWEVSSDSQQQVLEWGLRKSYTGGDSQFFVGTWVSGVFQGYNANVTLVAGRDTTHEPGDTIPAAEINTNQNWVIQYDSTTSCGGSTGAWWMAYHNNWVLYVCKTVFPTGTGLRNGTADFNQVFGEITYQTSSTGCTGCLHVGYYCSDVGRGNQGSLGATPAAYFDSVRFFGNATTNPPLDLFVRTVPTSPLYGRITVSKYGNRGFFFGGPGSDSTNSGIGTVNAC